MTGIRTNRDLYRAVIALIQGDPPSDRSLEEYLRALWSAAVGHRERESLSGDEFFGLLTEAFTRPAPPFNEAWRRRYGTDTADTDGFPGWEGFIYRQIVDLHEMAERGMLDNELRYFGQDAPRGGRWYNFDPRGFLECAVEGTFGGWQPGDNTRVLVPGPVVVMGDDGSLRECDPRDVTPPVVEITPVTWDDFRDFLGNGQWYE